MTDDEMNVRDAAARLGVHENTLRGWVGKAILQPSRVLPGSGFKRFNRADVERMRAKMYSAMPEDSVDA